MWGEKICKERGEERRGEMWGFRSPTPRGRTESCTLRILTDALTGAHRKGLHVEIYRADALSYRRSLAHSRRAWISRCAPPHSYEWCRRGRRHPASSDHPLLLPREHQKSIRRMRSVQDSVLPEGRGGEASPHIPPLHSGRRLR